MVRLAAATLVLILLLAGCAQPPSENVAGDQQGPAWRFIDTDGQAHSRDSSNGTPTILFFMATWCSSCRANAPRLAQVHSEFVDRGLDVYSLSWDPGEDTDDLRRWMSDLEQPWPHGLDTNSQAAQTFQVIRQSTLVVLDSSGQVHKKFGYPGAGEAQLRDAVSSAFEA